MTSGQTVPVGHLAGMVWHAAPFGQAGAAAEAVVADGPLLLGAAEAPGASITTSQSAAATQASRRPTRRMWRARSAVMAHPRLVQLRPGSSPPPDYDGRQDEHGERRQEPSQSITADGPPRKLVTACSSL